MFRGGGGRREIAYSHGNAASAVVTQGTKTTTYAYDENGNEIKQLEEKNKDYKETNPALYEKTEFKYENGTETAVTTAYNKTTTTVTQPNGDSVTTEKNNDGTVVITTKTADKTTTRTESNDGSAVEVVTDGQGKEVTTKFNANGKRTEQTVADNGETYSVKYDGKGNTYVVVQNGETPASIAQKFHTNTKTILSMNTTVVDALGNKYFEAGKTIKVPGEFNANAGVIKNRKSAKEARRDYKNLYSWKEEVANFDKENRADQKISWTEKKYNKFVDIAKNLYKQEYIENPTMQQLNKRVAELKKLNPKLKDGELIGKKITATVASNIYNKVVELEKEVPLKKQAEKIYNSVKEKYPGKDYNVEITADKIVITNKKTKQKEFVGSINPDNGSYSLSYYKNNQIYSQYVYTANGELSEYTVFNEKTREYELFDPISEALYKDVTAKTAVGLPTTGKDFEKHIKQITPQNVFSVLNNYKRNHDESLLEAINSEWGLSGDVKARVLKHLNDCIVKNPNWNKPNCKFDKAFSQGQIGDCWLLASIAAAKRSPKGLEILNNTIKKNSDGSYTVKFKGADKAYTVTPLEIVSNSNYADGDSDVRILELAAEKHYNILGIEFGGNPAMGLDLLLGTNDKWKNLGRNYTSKPAHEKIAQLLQNPNIAITANINPFSKLFGLIVKDVKDDAEYKDDIAISHAYALVGIDSKNVYLQNPWDTSKTVKIPLDVFDDYWGSVQYTEIK